MSGAAPVVQGAAPSGRRPAWSRIERVALWWLASAPATAALAWVAFHVQQEGIAPAVLFPLAVGGGLGASLAALRGVCGAPRRAPAICAAGALGLLVVAGQDYIGHRHRLRQFDAQIARQAQTVAVLAQGAELRPSWSEHLARRVSSRPAWWGLELLLTAGAAATAMALISRPRAVVGPPAS